MSKQGEAVPAGIWWRLGISLVIAGQAMVFSLGMNLTPPDAFGVAYWILHGLLIASTFIVTLLLGIGLLRSTFRALSRGVITVEVMFALSVIGAWVASLISTIRGEGPVFYEVVVIVLSIYTLGKTVGLQAKDKAWKEVRALRALAGQARVLGEDGKEMLVALETVNPGMVVAVDAGDMITVDGIVLNGKAFVEESAMTGEPTPVEKFPGSTVLAGTYSLDGRLTIRVNHASGTRLLDDVLLAVEKAGLKPSLWQEQADRLMQLFVPIVICVSVSTFVLWTAYANWTTALFHSMAVLLVACPCALGLATPIAVWSALWNLVSRGLVVKTGVFLDILARSTYWVFDKTGTLSHERLEIGSWSFNDHLSFDDAHEIKRCVIALERGLTHPIAKAFEGCLLDTSHLKVLERRWEAGAGVVGTVESENKRWHLRVGSLSWLGQAMFLGPKRLGIELNGVFVGYVSIQEKLRPDTEKTLLDLRNEGLVLAILTGDASPCWESLGGVFIKKGLSPVEKAAFVKEKRKEGEVVILVGDGLNDAQAMTDASASVALKAGAMLAQSTAEAILMGEGIAPLLAAYRLSLRVRKCIRSNMIIALGYNVIGVGFAAAGYLHPVVAALIMGISSAIVSCRAIRSAKLG